MIYSIRQIEAMNTDTTLNVKTSPSINYWLEKIGVKLKE